MQICRTKCFIKIGLLILLYYFYQTCAALSGGTIPVVGKRHENARSIDSNRKRQTMAECNRCCSSNNCNNKLCHIDCKFIFGVGSNKYTSRQKVVYCCSKQRHCTATKQTPTVTETDFMITSANIPDKKKCLYQVGNLIIVFYSIEVLELLIMSSVKYFTCCSVFLLYFFLLY